MCLSVLPWSQLIPDPPPTHTPTEKQNRGLHTRSLGLHRQLKARAKRPRSGDPALQFVFNMNTNVILEMVSFLFKKHFGLV